MFSGIGPVTKLDISYDRAGRSTGSVFVTYENYEDAQEAVREFDGANAKGQPIRLKILPPRKRNAFDTAVGSGRPLAERVSISGARNRSRSRSPGRDYADEAARKNIDRYVPGGRRSRSPVRNRRRGEGGRRPGARRGGAVRDEGDRKGRDGRPKKTQEELDAEMEDYFTGQSAANGGGQAAAGQTAEEDIDMIE